MVRLLNEIFSSFDGLVEGHQVEKIKTMGDAYLAAAGLGAQRLDQAEAMVQLGLEMRRAVAEFNRQYQTQVRLRVGIHTGPVVAGVIGRQRFAYDLWGDTVNVVCGLGQAAEPDGILVSAGTFERVRHRFGARQQQKVELKGHEPIDAVSLKLP